MSVGQMVDIETLATRPNAIILSIGACRFNVETGEIFDKFYVNIDPKTCKEIGLVSDPDTIDWWKKQNPAVIAALQVDQKPLYDALLSFHSWLNKDQELYAHGLNFDIPTIEWASKALGLTPNWKYWNLRCSRTLGEFFGVKPERDESSHHNALDDVIAQAKGMIKMCQMISE